MFFAFKILTLNLNKIVKYTAKATLKEVIALYPLFHFPYYAFEIPK